MTQQAEHLEHRLLNTKPPQGIQINKNMDIESVLIGNDPATGLPLHRRQLYFRASTIGDIIHVYYEEFLLVNDKEIEKKEKLYIVKDVSATPEVLDEDGVTVITPGTPEFLGFTNWVNYDVGVFPNGVTMGTIITGAINAQLLIIPIDAISGHIVTN